VEEPNHEGSPGRVSVDPANKPDVELNESGRQLHDVAEAGDPRPGIIDRNSHRGSYAADCGAQGGIIVDEDVLGHFEDERPIRFPEEIG
jgi:hypothetical protein